MEELRSHMTSLATPTRHQVNILTAVAKQHNHGTNQDSDQAVRVIACLLSAFVGTVKKKSAKDNEAEHFELVTNILGHILEWLQVS